MHFLWRNEVAVPLPKRAIKATVKVSVKTKTKAKKLPSWLRASLRDVKEGGMSGPFDIVEELRTHLEGG